MTGKTHITGGIALSLLICNDFVSFILVLVGSILPDIDHNDLIPFETRVLVRNAGGEWMPALYTSSDPNSKGCYALVYRGQCIPYKGNEYLSGKTNDCDDFYKTWE